MQQQPAVVSELLFSETTHAPTDVPSLLNNSACLLLVPAGTKSQWIIPPAASEKKNPHCLDTHFLQPDFLLPGRFRSMAFHASSFRFRIELKTIAFITYHNPLQHVTISVTKLKLRQHSTRCFLCSAVKERGTNLEQILLFCKSVARIFVTSSLPTPRRSASGLMVICLSCITVARVFSRFSLDRAETSRPGRGSSSCDSLPSSKRAKHRKTCARLGH